MTKKIILLVVFAVTSSLTVRAQDLKYSPKRLNIGLQAKKLHYDKKMVEATEIALSRAHKYSTRRCWRAVKTALLVADAVSSRPTSRLAKQAGDELEQKFGFRKIAVTNPFDAPVGSLLVYGGHGGGHIEFRTKYGFVSDFTSERPSRRPLIGVYVRV
jgi:hypothetical protein